ncbi:MAG: ribosome maturation factor RimP [Rickettsiales bacterium]|nr:ribosome maturation factor RimP [Rickettsiales bacterium]
MVVEDKIESLLKETISDLGYEIVRIRYFDHSKVLQIMIDHKNGTAITVDDCEIVSNTVSVILDVDDPITSNYHLEVSSAGLDRPLVKIDDYIRFKGSAVKIKVSTPIDGIGNFKGVIEEVVANDVIISLDAQQKVMIDFDNIVSANLMIDTKKLFNKKRFYG